MPPTRDQVIASYQQQIAELGQQNQLLQQLLHQRSEPMLAATLDALNNLSAMAEQGHSGARDLLAKWNAALERARNAAPERPSGIVVANGHVPRT